MFGIKMRKDLSSKRIPQSDLIYCFVLFIVLTVVSVWLFIVSFENFSSVIVFHFHEPTFRVVCLLFLFLLWLTACSCFIHSVSSHKLMGVF